MDDIDTARPFSKGGKSMNKTLTLLSFLVSIAFLGGVTYMYGHAAQSISQSALSTNPQSVSMPKAFDRVHVFSDLKRAAVMDSRGQYVGVITDLVISTDGRISFAVFSPLRVYGINERLVALPFNALSLHGKYIVLNTTSERLVNAPIFRMSYLNAQNWAEDANRYFGVSPSWGEGILCKKPEAGAYQLPVTKGWDRPYGASEIVGTQVKNLQGEAVGKITDLVFDEDGRIFFAVLGYGGFLGIRQSLVAVPINSLSSAEEPGHFFLNTTKEEVQSAPLFSKKALDDPSWVSSVYRYFGQQPYWTNEK